MNAAVTNLRRLYGRAPHERIREMRAGLLEAADRLAVLAERQRYSDAEHLAQQLAGLQRTAAGLAHELREAQPETPDAA